MAYYRRSKNWSHSINHRGGPTTLNYSRYTSAPSDPAEIARIDAVINDPSFSLLPSNKQDFINSIKSQAASKKLSDAQISYLASIEKSLLPVDNSWWDDNEAENVKKRQFVIDYYGATGYYSTIIPKMKADPAFMPDRGIWDKMWSNKFINARYKRFIEGNKHNIGDIVIGKFSYGSLGPHNGIVQNVSYHYADGRWQYEILVFEAGRVMYFKDSEVKAVKQPKPAKKARSKKAQ